MRRLLSLFIALAVFVTACTKPEPDNPQPNPETPKQESVTLASGTNAAPVIATEGGSTSVSFTASTSWSASIINTKADSWCSVSPTSGVAGAASITITAKENTTPDNRSASIVITAGTATQAIKVEQKQKNSLTVTASSFEVSADGGEIKVATKSNVTFTHTISTDAQSWIKAVQTKALKDSTLTFEIDVNKEVEKRSGQIYLTSGDLKDTVNVYQAGETPTIVVGKDEYVLKTEGESFEIEVASNVNATMNIVYPQGVEAWIVENTSKSISTNKFYFTAKANEGYDSRSAMIVFSNAENNLADTVTVSQAQKDAIVVAKSEYEFDKQGGNLDFEIQTNVDVTVSIAEDCKSWITQVETRALETKKLFFNVAACDTLTIDRTGVITISGGDITQTVKITQSNIKEILAAEREALIAFYNSTGGDNWTNNTNWCSDKPVGEWYGISVSPTNRVTTINLNNNNLVGNFPSLSTFQELEYLDLAFSQLSGAWQEVMQDLKKLKYLNLESVGLTGVIPSCIGDMTLLEMLSFHGNMLEGEIPEELSNLSKLISVTFAFNKLTGSIPKWLGELSELESLRLDHNGFSGTVPESLTSHKNWEKWWYDIVLQEQEKGGNLDRESYSIKGPEFKVQTINGGEISNEIFAKNKYTAMFSFSHDCGESLSFTPILVAAYEKYKDKGFGVFTLSRYNTAEINSYFIKRFNINWDCTVKVDWNSVFGPYLGNNPAVYVFDSTGTLVFGDYLGDDPATDFINFLKDKMGDVGEITPYYYESVDYSQDGKVEILQKATKGNGIDIVIMGDGYSDRYINDGTYDFEMKIAYDKFFEVEPYKSFKEMFNVYKVTTVSKNDIFDTGLSTALEGNTSCFVNQEKVFPYALKAIDENRMEEAVIIVVLNDKWGNGKCFMFQPDTGDYGGGTSIAVISQGENTTRYGELVHHEAGGHGFAKLGDEYSYDYMGVITEQDIASYEIMEPYGWWKNVDFTNDTAQVKWAKFLADTRYKNDGLGVFEGGLTYWRGVWRPTENSIMRYNTGGFNAPSREAIYYRIHKLAYGEDWEYDYEKFVEWDAINRKTEAQTKSMPLVLDPERSKLPHTPPVVIPHSWKEAR